MAEKYEFGRRYYLLWRKRPNNILTSIGLIFLFAFQFLSCTSAEGNVGCHFVKTLCLDRIEFCYDDLVFGQCLPLSGVDQEEITREPLTEQQSQILADMLEEMQGAGLGWDHPFVQCKIQGTLFSLRRQTPLPPNLCANLAPDPEIFNSQAVIRFTPPNQNFADEFYYPPQLKRSRLENGPNPIFRSARRPSSRLGDDVYLKLAETVHQDPAYDTNMANRMKDIRNRIELQKMMAEYEQTHNLPPPVMSPNLNIYDRKRNGENLIPHVNFDIYNRKRSEDSRDEQMTNDENKLPRTFFREIAVSENIPYSHYQSNAFGVEIPLENLRKFNDEEEDESEIFKTNRYPIRKHHKKTDGLYTEGGMLIVPEDDAAKENDDANKLLAEMLGFTRHERLDVKKPGPTIGPSIDKSNSSSKEVLPAHIKSETVGKSKKTSSDDEVHAPHIVDTEYAYVKVKNPLDTWIDGDRIVKELANILHMQGTFSHIRVDHHEVSWRVNPSNIDRKNATEVAIAISDVRVKNNILRRLGVTITETGIGDKVKSRIDGGPSPRIELAENGPDVTHIMVYMLVGAGFAAGIVIMVTLFLIRRNDKKRDKLGGLKSTGGAETCSDDYQDLCRARMSGKPNSNEPAQGGRITSLTKENDRPPSSRSSTSSWSEEPALTNMDISTGHMVLSYMEDHLRNKGRLQREWEALCRYEAEPSARDAALQTQCSALNRVGAPLPYDHSRVVLNHLANAEGLDYINASTITDHDPRAPAYVAAQGPLTSSLAHFWQMIWEQGAVVIVTLGKLQENGEVSCARYWPDEGAEVYHIYEVNLVSEHIWCDDYLVRSFYLKNLRTSESRTVTQFHFLSWPQNGVPSSAKALLDFRRKVNKSYRGRSCPIVVHGSTGAGRTGAYILLDLVLGRMNKGAREIDIAATLEHLRDQRAGLVANRQQFEFVLMAVAEEVHAILKNLPANQTEKRELDKDPVKEEEAEKQNDNGEKSKESTKTLTQEKKKENDKGQTDKKEEK